jgi:lysophospholipase L1-like esterase
MKLGGRIVFIGDSITESGRWEDPEQTDGVHMNSIGNMLMARTWMDAVKKVNGSLSPLSFG